MDKQFKKDTNNTYKKLRFLLLVFAAFVIEGSLLRLLGYDNNDPLWLWGAWLICGFTVCLFFYYISKIIQNKYEFISKTLLICSWSAWILGLIQNTLGLIR